MTGPRYDLLREEEDRWDRIRREEDEAEAKRKGFAKTLADQSSPVQGGVSSENGLRGRSLRTLNRGNDLGDLTVTEKERPRTIARALAIGASDPGTREGRDLADRNTRKMQEDAERAKRAFSDVAALPFQAGIGEVENLYAKTDALAKGMTQPTDEFVREMDEQAQQDTGTGRGRSFGPPEDTGMLAPTRKALNDISGKMMGEGGVLSIPLPYDIDIPLQLASRIGGNMFTEVAAFRGSGKAVQGGVEGLSKMYEGTKAGSRFAQLDRLSKLANEARGARGVAQRVGRDFFSNLPVNTVNASDENLSAAGGLAAMGEMAGGKPGQGVTGWLEKIAADPTKRHLFENALDVGLGGAVEAGLEGFKGARGLVSSLGKDSDAASREIAGTLEAVGRENGRGWRNAAKDNQYMSTGPQQQNVTVEPGAEGTVTPPDEFPTGRPVPRDENIPDPPDPEYVAPLHDGPFRDLPAIGTTTYRGRTKYLGNPKWAYKATEDLEAYYQELLLRSEEAARLEGEGARWYSKDVGMDKPQTGFVPTNDFGRGKRMGMEIDLLLPLVEQELKGRYNALDPEELAARPTRVDFWDSGRERDLPGDEPDGVWEPIPDEPNAIPGEEGFIAARPNLPTTDAGVRYNAFGQRVFVTRSTREPGRFQATVLRGASDSPIQHFTADSAEEAMRLAEQDGFRFQQDPRLEETDPELYEKLGELDDIINNGDTDEVIAAARAEYDEILAGLAPRIQASPNLFGDVNVGRTGQQEMFDAEDLTAQPKPLEPAPGGGAPEMPGKITAEEMAARRAELGGEAQAIEGSDDAAQLQLSPMVRGVVGNATQIPAPAAPVMVLGNTGAPLGVVDTAAGEALAVQYGQTLNAEPARNTVSKGPASADPVVDANGVPIPRAMAKEVLRDFAAGMTGAVAGGSQGDTWGERATLAAAGGAVGLGGSKLATLAARTAKRMLAKPTPEMQSMHRMVGHLRDAFGTPTRAGTRWWGEMSPKERKTAGGYIALGPGFRLIRLRSAADARTMFHEVGHNLEADFTKSLGMNQATMLGTAPQDVLNELYGLGRALYPAGHSASTYLSEGFAEWAARFVRGQDMDALAPNASKALRQILDANPKQKAALEAAKQEFAQFLAGTPEERAMAQMAGVGGESSLERDYLRDFYDQHIDLKETLRSVGIEPELIRGVKFKDNGYTAIRRADKARGYAENALRQGVYDESSGKFITRPLMQVFQALTPKELDNEFIPYLFAERTLELNDRSYTVPGVDANGNPTTRTVFMDPVETGMAIADARAIVNSHRAKYEKLAEIVWEHQAAMLDLRTNAGMGGFRENAHIKRVNQKHIPLYAQFDEMYERVGGQGAGGASSGNGLFRMKGSKRNRKNPLESILGDTFRTYQQTMQHQALINLTRFAMRHPEGSKILTVLRHPPTQRTEVDAQEAMKQLQKMGWDVGYNEVKAAKAALKKNDQTVDLVAAQDLVDRWEALIDQTVQEYSTITRPTRDDARNLVMPVQMAGKQVWVQVNDVRLYESLNGMGVDYSEQSNLVEKMYGVAKGMTSVFRQSATLAPSFIQRNPGRDAWSAYRRTNKEGMLILGEHLIRGLGVMINHYANGAKTGPLPPPGASRVLAQIGRQADRAARAAIRTNVGTSTIGAAAGAAMGDTPEERMAYAAAGAGLGAGVGMAAKNASTDVVDLYDMWMAAGGGGVSFAGIDVNDHSRTIADLSRSTVEKNVGIFHPIEALRSVAQISEMANRLGELQIVMRQQLAKGASMSDARAAALHSAAEVTQDFTKGGRISMAWNQLLPFFNASLVGKMDLAKDMTDPVKVQRQLLSVTAASLALWALQQDDPEYQDTEQHYKDSGWVLVWPPKNIRDLGMLVKEQPQEMGWMTPGLRSYLEEMAEEPVSRFIIPKPFESGVLFGSLAERIGESYVRATDNNPETDPNQAGGLMYKPLDFFWNFVRPGSLPPLGAAAVDLAMNKDFAGRDITPKYLANAPAEDRAQPRTGETARTLARATDKLDGAGGTGVGAATIERLAGIAGPLAQVPIGISDAVIRKAREIAGADPMRAEPPGGFGTIPTSWGRAFEKGEIAGGGAAVNSFYETLEKAKGKWKAYDDAPEGSDRKRELWNDPLVKLYRTKGEGKLRVAEGTFRKLRDRKREALERGDEAEAKRLDREITLEGRRIMREVARVSQ